MKFAAICVDDDPVILQLLGQQLVKILDRTEVLISSFSGTSFVQDHIRELTERHIPVRFLISDHRIAGKSGYEMLRHIKEKFPDISCILLSAQADKFEVRELIDNGVITSYLRKPWTEQELQRALEKGVGIPISC